MIFNEKEMIELCERLGIEVIEGNVPLMNGKPITDDDIIGLFHKYDTNTVTVTLEEHLVKEVPVEIPDYIEDPNDRMMIAEEIVRNKYRNSEIVLDADNFSGVTLYSLKDEKTGEETEWCEL